MENCSKINRLSVFSLSHTALALCLLLSTPVWAADSDNDGMDDDWELLYGLNPADPGDAATSADSDSLTNLEEYQYGTNPLSSDTDGDSLGDTAEIGLGTDPTDPDSDDDGLNDHTEIVNGYDPHSGDSDGDTLPDKWEHDNNTQVTTHDAGVDQDNDGLTNSQEYYYGTLPDDDDTDNDTVTDGYEISEGMDPFDTDSDDDSLGDGAEVSLGTDPLLPDTDSDGIGDHSEVVLGSDPLNSDTDMDGTVDGSDNCVLVSNVTQLDTDGDGDGNACDNDDDGDGVADIDDAFPLDSTETTDFDSDGIGDNADTDDDADGVEDAYDAFPYDATEWADTDFDGVGDNADDDSDNDGFGDSEDLFPQDMLLPQVSPLFEITYSTIERIAVLADVNNDGCDDIAYADPNADLVTPVFGHPITYRVDYDAGMVSVISGCDQTVLYSRYGTYSYEGFGANLTAAGDVNGDGKGDFYTNNRLYSGENGATLTSSLSVTIPSADCEDYIDVPIAAAGDINNDGYDDIAVGHGIFSGADGVQIALYCNRASDEIQRDIAGVGDINGDGHDDVAVSSYREARVFIEIERSWVDIYSGADGSILHHIDGIAGQAFGFDLSMAGDINSDGYNDILVGTNLNVTAFGARRGSYIYSGTDASLLYHAQDYRVERLGRKVIGGGDFNGDGYDDWAAASDLADNSEENAGLLRLYSGADGGILYTVAGTAAEQKLGKALESGDINGDGYADIVVLDNSYIPVKVYSGYLHDYLVDRDGDLLDDAREASEGTDPLRQDTDIDGLSDYLEVMGITSPTNHDSDGDGVIDSEDATPLFAEPLPVDAVWKGGRVSESSSR